MLPPYSDLAEINRHFEQISECLARLDESGAFRGRFARQSIAICRATLGETCSWINFEVLQVLHDRAERDLARFGRIRHRLEKALERSSKARR
jgi:hypothetical protein